MNFFAKKKIIFYNGSQEIISNPFEMLFLFISLLQDSLSY